MILFTSHKSGGVERVWSGEVDPAGQSSRFGSPDGARSRRDKAQSRDDAFVSALCFIRRLCPVARGDVS